MRIFGSDLARLSLSRAVRAPGFRGRKEGALVGLYAEFAVRDLLGGRTVAEKHLTSWAMLIARAIDRVEPPTAKSEMFPAHCNFFSAVTFPDLRITIYR